LYDEEEKEKTQNSGASNKKINERYAQMKKNVNVTLNIPYINCLVWDPRSTVSNFLLAKNKTE
jgi:hypothetical protein